MSEHFHTYTNVANRQEQQTPNSNFYIDITNKHLGMGGTVIANTREMRNGKIEKLEQLFSDRFFVVSSSSASFVCVLLYCLNTSCLISNTHNHIFIDMILLYGSVDRIYCVFATRYTSMFNVMVMPSNSLKRIHPNFKCVQW